MNKQKARLLYVEDDDYLSFVTKDNLEVNGYNVVHARDGLQAKELFKNHSFDLCILDVMLPHVDGFSLAEHIRETNQHIPIIFLTARSMKEDLIKGLTMGGDDYITKPFSIEELILKIEIFLKRNKISSPDKDLPDTFKLGSCLFEKSNLQITCKERVTTLTQKEAELLSYLCLHPNEVIKRDKILETVWGSESLVLSRSLDVFISRLRKLLKEDNSVRLETVHGVGFKLVIPE